MNWKEFKDAVESKGVTDDMKIWYIDIDCWIETSDLDVDSKAAMYHIGVVGE